MLNCYFIASLRSLLLLCILCLAQSVWATHNRAGEITYEQIGPNTIRATITTYTKVSGNSLQADRPSLTLNWGDGTSEDINRLSEDYIYPDIKRNRYVAEHTYAGANTPNRLYLLSMGDPNRNGDILNIDRGNSISIPFYLETEVYLFASSSMGYNSSPILLEPPIDFGAVGQIFQHTPNGYDPDGDSLVYKLVTPRSGRGEDVRGYEPVSAIVPGPNNTYIFDTRTGLFTWDSPQGAGYYNIAILVESYRNGIKVGSVLRDIQIEILRSNNTPPLIEAPTEICVVAGETIQFSVKAFDNDLPTQLVYLTATGGPFEQNISPATFNNSSGNPIYSTFNWNTVCSHIRSQPYQVVFKARDNFTINGGNVDASLATFHVLNIKVIPPPPQNLQANAQPNAITLTWDAPYTCEEADGFLGFSIWKKKGCDSYTPDSCEVGGLAARGYVRINPTLITTPTGTSYSFIDTDLEQGDIYSYRVLGEFASPIYGSDGRIISLQAPISSIMSDEVCVRMARALPFITHVDINTTTNINGEIFVQWSKPNAVELDTLQNMPPYRYELYRSTDMAGNQFDANPIFVSPWYNSYSEANDTNYTDIATIINTEDSPYAYRVAFLVNNGDTLGYTGISSTVRLEVTGGNEENNLSWSHNVRWSNYLYRIYTETPLASGNFVLLDSTTENTYVHTDLNNGYNYCYYIESIGTYGDPNIVDPLYNKSQIACAIPKDTIAPCPPTIYAISGCLEDSSATAQNLIYWTGIDTTCADDAITYRIYFAPYCNGDYTLVTEINNLADTFFYHTPTDNNWAGCYYVTTIDSLHNGGIGGGGNESIPSIIAQTDNCPIYDLPNTFTPNGDGHNDLFKPYMPYRFIKSVEFVVVNRWGETVFETTDPALNWDGKDMKSGKDLAEGTYFFTCIAYPNTIINTTPFKFKGNITLIRGGE